MQGVSSQVPKRERRVHWPLNCTMEDMLCAWTKVTPSEQFRLEQVCRRNQLPSCLRCQLGHCPLLPWVSAKVDALSLGYTGRFRCIGFTPSETPGANYLVDSATLPSCMWHGIILLERCGVSAMDPPLSVVPLDVCVVEGEHDLRDGSKLCLFTPQRKLPMLDSEFEIDMLAYQVILALVEDDV
eukprot:896663-Amphidinium_carterae.1